MNITSDAAAPLFFVNDEVLDLQFDHLVIEL